MLNKIESKEGYVFALKDKSEIYDDVIYLGKYDNADNYIEVTKEEATQIRQQIEEAYRREYEASLNKN